MILITGGANRIGAAIARQLARKNKIIIHYNSSGNDAKQLVAELHKHGTEVILWQQDLRASDLPQRFQRLIDANGPIDVLINNAAIFSPEKDKLGEITYKFYQEVMDVNFAAPLCLMQEFARHVPKKSKANIINILDQRVLNISHAFPVYTASKTALWALTQNMALALAPNIRVNAIAPGHVLPTQGEDESKFKARSAKTLLGAGTTPEEIAATVEFILNSKSITGACIPVDGGEHLVPKQKTIS